MIEIPPLKPFEPRAPDAAGVISWAHIGDLHMTLAGQPNHLNLIRIVQEINEAFAGSLSFVFIPGDVADHGSIPEYEVVRQALDRVQTPWCSIVGDHDVHEKSFLNFQQFMSKELRYAFTIGRVRFLAMNAFDVPDPGSFILLSDQLMWLKHELEQMQPEESAVLLLHCYPTDLKQGGGELRSLVAEHKVRLIEMGHTHYNEVANDGQTLYIATRSTGQIEEGPVGFSVTNVDGPVVSWKFFTLEALPAVTITSPSDERFITEQNVSALTVHGVVRVRAKICGRAGIRSAMATLLGSEIALAVIAGSQVWEGTFEGLTLADGVYSLRVNAIDDEGRQAGDEIRIVIGEAAYTAAQRAERDQDNPLGAWPERGLLGTQLGPNKFGKKW